MKLSDDISTRSTNFHHFITIASLVVSLICFVMFYYKIDKMNSDLEGVLSISIMKSEYLTKINDIIYSRVEKDESYQKNVAGIYKTYVSDIFNSKISDAVKFEEEHFAENIYLQARDQDARQIYHDIAIDNNRFPELAKNLLDQTKATYNRQLIILILIPTLMALLRCIQSIYYFYSLRKLRGNYMIDPLTGVYNRRYLPRIRETEGICYILAIDVDNFKTVNDNWGHAFGDTVLQQCTYRMKEHLRDHDIVVRMGGDEFSIFLFKTDEVGAQRAAQRLLDTINEQALELPDGGTFTPSLSIGMAKCHGNVELAMNIADQNLYKSKKKGKNTISFGGDK